MKNKGNDKKITTIIAIVIAVLAIAILIWKYVSYNHQVQVTTLCFKACRLGDIANRRKRAYMKHEMFILFSIAIIFARLNGSEQAKADYLKMWDDCRAFDLKWANRFRYRTALFLLCVPGKFGEALVRFFYWISHKVVRFN